MRFKDFFFYVGTRHSDTQGDERQNCYLQLPKERSLPHRRLYLEQGKSKLEMEKLVCAASSWVSQAFWGLADMNIRWRLRHRYSP